MFFAPHLMAYIFGNLFVLFIFLIIVIQYFKRFAILATLASLPSGLLEGFFSSNYL